MLNLCILIIIEDDINIKCNLLLFIDKKIIFFTRNWLFFLKWNSLNVLTFCKTKFCKLHYLSNSQKKIFEIFFFFRIFRLSFLKPSWVFADTFIVKTAFVLFTILNKLEQRYYVSDFLILIFSFLFISLLFFSLKRNPTHPNIGFQPRTKEERHPLKMSSLLSFIF